MKIILLAVTLIVSGCGGSDSVPITEESGALTSPFKPSEETNVSMGLITGSWEFTYSGTGCVERYSFGSDSKYLVNSLDEVTSGVYTIEDPLIAGGAVLPELNMVVVGDNQLADCLGSSNDETGSEFTLYVKFLGNDAMQWYDDRTGSLNGNLLVTMTRK